MGTEEGLRALIAECNTADLHALATLDVFARRPGGIQINMSAKRVTVVTHQSPAVGADAPTFALAVEAHAAAWLERMARYTACPTGVAHTGSIDKTRKRLAALAAQNEGE